MMELSKIPVVLITGFLGSGKTTLLNRLLTDGVKTAVVINEFGATPIDQDLLLHQDIPMTVLSGGCLCCQIKGALAPTLKNLWMAWQNADAKPFERLIIETSGVASPEPILDTLLREAWLSKRYRLQHIITTLAIPSAVSQLQNYAEAYAQMAWADLILLTHADLADAAQLEALKQYLQRHAPATPKQFAQQESFDITELANDFRPFYRRIPSGNLLPEHRFRSVSVYLEQTPNWPRLQAILQSLVATHKGNLVRIKGIVYPPDCPNPLAVHAVDGHWYEPVSLQERPNQDRRSRLVLITVSDAEPLADALLINLGIESRFKPILLH